MKQLILLGTLAGIVSIMVFLTGESGIVRSARNETLPEVEFLGEGAGTYTTELEQFIVFRGPGIYEFEPGPSYTAVEGERIWSVNGAAGHELQIWNNSVYNLGPTHVGCVVHYVGIDDAPDGIRNGFFVGSELVELIREGMVFEGEFTTLQNTIEFWMVAEESIAGWYTPCIDSGPTETPTDTPDPGFDNIFYLPLVLFGGDPPPPPTSTPTATATVSPPTATPTNTPQSPTATPTESPVEYTVECSELYDFEVIDDKAKFEFAAFAFEDVQPLADVDLRAKLIPRRDVEFVDVEETNFEGKADFRMDISVLWLSQDVYAEISFDDQGTYGDDFCVITFEIN